MRIGIGYDMHRLVSGRRLVLGGVEIPYNKGLLGHSDADVLIHVVCDALLGAAGKGDIGGHFPETEDTWAGIESLELLKHVKDLIGADWTVANIDVTVMAQAPKIGPFREKMQHKLAAVLNLSPGRINIKATTTEGLGAIGRGEGIAAQSIVLLQRNVA